MSHDLAFCTACKLCLIFTPIKTSSADTQIVYSFALYRNLAYLCQHCFSNSSWPARLFTIWFVCSTGILKQCVLVDLDHAYERTDDGTKSTGVLNEYIT